MMRALLFLLISSAALAQSAPLTYRDYLAQVVSGASTRRPTWTGTAASGVNAFAVANDGARIDFGAGASDYASSDGTTVTFAGKVAIADNLTIRNNTATTWLNVGVAGTAYFYITSAAKVFIDSAALTTAVNGGRLQVYVGSSTGVGEMPVVARKVYAVVGNVGAGEDDLMSYALPASAMAQDGSGVRLTAWGSGANNANAKTVKCYFGATALVTTALTASQVNSWRVVGEVLRTGAATQVADGFLVQGGTAALVDAENSSPTETLSGAVTIKCTGTATDNDDVTQKGLIVEYL